MKLVAAVLLLSAEPAVADSMPLDLAKTVAAYEQAQLGSDVPALTSLVSDDFLLVNSNASVENKTQFLADYRLPGFHIDGYKVEQRFAHVWDAAAVQGGILHLTWTQDGKHDMRTLRIAYVWRKRNGRWRATYAQVTRVPQ